MTDLVYINGQFCPAENAQVSAFDRGFLFADGVYEVIPIYNGELFKQDLHWARLSESINALQLANNDKNSLIDSIKTITRQLIEKNNLQSGAGKLYVQITRGASLERTHIDTPKTPTIFVTTTKLNWPTLDSLKNGISAITIKDTRANWQKHKTISNLQNIIGLQQAAKENASEAIWYNQQSVLEGCHSNVFWVKDNVLYTPSSELPVLIGVTRNLVIELAEQLGIKCVRSLLKIDELKQADEIFITGSTKTLQPINKLDDRIIGSGGPIWQQLFASYQQTIPTKAVGAPND
jgi:D-alanine transaminase